MSRLWLTHLALFVLLIALPALAQRTTGTIIGIVTDESNSVLPGVSVTLKSTGVPGAPRHGDGGNRCLPLSEPAAGRLYGDVRIARALPP